MANEALNTWNRALALIGAPRVSSTTEVSSQKELVDDHWTVERQSFLSLLPWDGCTTVEDLVENTTATIPDRWTTAFDLPSSPVFLQAWRVNSLAKGSDEQPLWEIISLPGESPSIKVLLTDESAARLEYSWDLSIDADLALLSPLAFKALGYQLAVALARPWGKKEQDIVLLERQAEQALSKAMFANGKQQKRKAVRSRPLVDARTRRLN